MLTLQAVAEEGITTALTVPTQLLMLTERPRWGRPLPRLRSFVSGGAACPPALAARVREAGYRFREGYGLTECGPNCFSLSDDEARARPGSVGWPVPFLEMRLGSGQARPRRPRPLDRTGGGRLIEGARAKGSALRSTLAFVADRAGDGAVDDVLGRLRPEERRAIAAVSPTDEVPMELMRSLWRATDAVLGPADPGWPERSGAYSIEGAGVQLYGGILLKQSPLEFLAQLVSLFRLFYQPDNMEVLEIEPGRAVLRLVGFDPGDTTFCRRQTGGLLRSVELAGGATPLRPPRPLLRRGRRLQRMGAPLGLKTSPIGHRPDRFALEACSPQKARLASKRTPTGRLI